MAPVSTRAIIRTVRLAERSSSACSSLPDRLPSADHLAARIDRRIVVIERDQRVDVRRIERLKPFPDEVERIRAHGLDATLLDTMKSLTKYLTLNIPSKMAFRNITPEVDEAVRASGVQEGLVLVNTMHITASVFINDDERGLHHDFGTWLEALAPFNPDPDHYHHNRTGEDNADAHLKRQIMGREVVVAITKGQARLRPVGADLLRRIRRPPLEAGADQNHR